MSLIDLLGSSASDSAQQLITFTYARQRLLADNVANIDTPGYRGRDLSTADFHRSLVRSLRNSRLTNANLPRLSAGSSERLAAAARGHGSDGGIVFHDDNNRSPERLMYAMSKNFQLQQQASNLLLSQIRLLRTIIAGNVTQ